MIIRAFTVADVVEIMTYIKLRTTIYQLVKTKCLLMITKNGIRKN